MLPYLVELHHADGASEGGIRLGYRTYATEFYLKPSGQLFRLRHVQSLGRAPAFPNAPETMVAIYVEVSPLEVFLGASGAGEGEDGMTTSPTKGEGGDGE